MSTGRHLADSLALKIALVAVWLRCDPETDRRCRRERRCRIGPAVSRSGDRYLPEVGLQLGQPAALFRFFATTPRTQLGETPRYEITPDGQRFIAPWS